MQEFLGSRGKSFSNFKYFSIPKFVYGDVNDEGEGVLVLDDLSSRGFRVFDAALLLLDDDHLRVAVAGLAEFHALTLAHDLTSEQKLVSGRP